MMVFPNENDVFYIMNNINSEIKRSNSDADISIRDAGSDIENVKFEDLTRRYEYI